MTVFSWRMTVLSWCMTVSSWRMTVSSRRMTVPSRRFLLPNYSVAVAAVSGGYFTFLATTNMRSPKRPVSLFR